MAEPCDWAVYKSAFPLKSFVIDGNVGLRPLSRNDLDDLCAFMTADADMTWTRKPWSRRNVEYLLNLRLQHYETYGFGPYAVTWGGRLIGMAGAQAWHASECTGEILVYIAKSMWGRGIATRIVEWLLARAKKTKSIPQIYAATRPENARAIQLLEEFGFSIVGRGVHFGYPAIEWRVDLAGCGN